MKSKSASRKWRLRTLWAAAVIAAAVFLGRLYWLQVVESSYYRDLASHQYYRPASSVFDRGNIYFTGKDGALSSAAALKSGFTLAVNPTAIKDAAAAYKAISKYIDIDKSDFLAKATKEDDSYEEITHRIDDATGAKISALGLAGVLLVRENWRVYPAGTLASHEIGFVGYQGDVLSGRYGLEKYYDDVLERNDSSSLYNNFFANIFTNVKDGVTNMKFEGDVVTSIEPSVQSELEKQLKDIQSEWNSDGTGGIIINPKTGEIYAMAAYPSFDPNNFQKAAEAKVYSNPLVERVYEMGSIIKPLTMAAGIDAGVVTASTTYDDKGTLVLNGSRISNFDGRGRGVVSMQEVLNQSLNTGAVFVEEQLGNAAFTKYMKAYGLGEETGIDLPFETHGLISNLDSSRDLEHATASFGQGIAMTPIETVRALASLINGGYLVTPHVAKSIKYEVGVSRDVAYDDKTRVLKASTSEEIERMLSQVYDNALLNGAVKMDHYTLGAKTGTAQIADLVHGGYYADRYLHSFFGFFPAYDAKYLVFLYTIDPKGIKYASQTLTYPFVDLAKFIISYYNLPPDR